MLRLIMSLAVFIVMVISMSCIAAWALERLEAAGAAPWQLGLSSVVALSVSTAAIGAATMWLSRGARDDEEQD